MSPFSSLPKSHTGRGGNIFCTQHKQQKTPHTLTKERVCMSLFKILQFSIKIQMHNLLTSFLHRDFLHPNFVQYSHNSTGNHKSPSQKSHVSGFVLILLVQCHSTMNRVCLFIVFRDTVTIMERLMDMSVQWLPSAHVLASGL